MKDNLGLINRIIEGDENAFDELLSNHHKMIYKIINNFNLERGDFTIDIEELYQEACIVLYDAVFSFEQNKNVKFSSYAYILIRSRIHNLLRDYGNIYKEEMYSIDNTKLIDKYMMYATSENPISYHKEEEFRKQLDKFIHNLPVQDRQILLLRGKDCSYKDISKHLNINTKKIDNRLRKLRKRIDSILMDTE